MGFCGEKPVFVDTNLGTHFAFPVHPDITTGDLKSKLEWEHSSCFPDLGKIKTHAVMVKKNSHSYHLSDAMPIKIACQGLVGAWFLCVDASWVPCIRSASQKLLSEQPLKSKIDESCFSKCETPTTSLVEKTSVVTGIISRYFPDYEEVNSCSSLSKSTRDIKKEVPRSASKMSSLLAPPFEKDTEASSWKTDRYEVGRRLVLAANNIEFSVSRKNLQKYFMIKSGCGKLSTVKSTGFEISDSND